MKKFLPFTKEEIEEIIKKYPIPFYIYLEKGIREGAKKFYKAFSWVDGFKNYFAVKACSNPKILSIGFLVTKMRHIKNIYKNYLGLDTCMVVLIRPRMYV